MLSEGPEALAGEVDKGHDDSDENLVLFVVDGLLRQLKELLLGGISCGWRGGGSLNRRFCSAVPDDGKPARAVLKQAVGELVRFVLRILPGRRSRWSGWIEALLDSVCQLVCQDVSSATICQ